MKKIILFIFSIVFISCAASKVSAPSNADVERGKATYPNLTLEAANAGKMNFEQQCSKCHGLKKPNSKTAEQWQKIVPGMAAKAEKKAGKVVIDQATQESILHYLVAMAKH